MTEEIQRQKLSWAEKTQILLSYVLRFTLVVAIGLSLYEKNWEDFYVSLLALVAFFFPAIVEKNLKITLPVVFEFILFIIIYANIFLGFAGQFFVKFWWWDVLMHSISGVGLGFAGFLILYTFYLNGKIKVRPIFLVFLTFNFALAIGVLWEIFEFLLDSFLGSNHQNIQTGVKDTMYDLILDGIGGLFSAILGYTYILKRRKGIFFGRLIESFFSRNPRLNKIRKQFKNEK